MFEVGGFLAGIISEAELGAQSVAYELSVVAYMVTVLAALSSVNLNLFHCPIVVKHLGHTDALVFVYSSRLESLLPPVCELGTLSVQETLKRQSCRAKFPSSVHVRVPAYTPLSPPTPPPALHIQTA